MKIPLLILTLLFVFVGFAPGAITVPTAKPVSDEKLLAAIAAVETGNNPTRLGRDGERSQLQILPTTWRRYSRLPHSMAASNRTETERVARAYLATIRARLKARGLPQTPFLIAAGWNAGPGWKTLKPRTISYAERVANLVGSSEPETIVAQAPVKTVPVKPVPIIPVAGVLSRGARLALYTGPGSGFDRSASN